MENIVFVSHCILNSLSKVKKNRKNVEESKKTLLSFLIDENIRIVQLPCPEAYCYGLKRWGHTREQFDNFHYRDQCRQLFMPYVHQMIEYEKNDYNVLAIIGVYGSPTCGVNVTCSGEWGGELKRNTRLNDLINEVKSVEGRGIFVEEMEGLLEEHGLKIPFIEYNGKFINHTIEELKDEMAILKEVI